MGTKTGLNGITFGDATVQNTAAVTGVSSAVAGTGVSVSAATGAVTFTNSGVTSIVAGTGISVSGATGAVTVTASGGGVTSLNGQTGAVVNTTFGNIGSVVRAYHFDSTRYYAGDTISGGNLCYPTTYATGSNSTWFSQGNGMSYPYVRWDTSTYGDSYRSGNVTVNQQPVGTTTLSGTWRAMQIVGPATGGYDSCSNVTNLNCPGGVWVRVS